ncbi:MAG: hypothetical protein ACOYK7_04725 [Pirellulales bacterium]
MVCPISPRLVHWLREAARQPASLGGLALVVTTLGCGPRPVEHTVQKVVPETVPSAPESPEAPAGEADRDGFKQLLARRLERFDAEIDVIRTKVMKLEEAAQAEWREKIAALVARRQLVQAKFAKAMEGTADAWDHLRQDAEHAWDELEQAIAKATEGL